MAGLPKLEVTIAGVTFKNPIMVAGGTFGYGVEFADILDIGRLGGLVVKGLSSRPLKGNPEPRLYETAGGLLNSVGLQNIGAEAFVKSKLPALRTCGTPIIANIFGYSLEEYTEVARLLNATEGIAAIELNISCPNTDRGGIEFASDLQLTHRIVGEIKRVLTRLPLFVKLSPNVGDIKSCARAAADGGADALTLVNTFLGMAINVETRRPIFANVVAGLSGPAIHPIALRLVHEAAHAVTIPIIGVGGVHKVEDALEFMIAGARAVQVGTANFYDPQAPIKIIDGLAAYARRNSLSDINDIVGSLIT
ncbi:MAG: dihydroorotate dehydrogenase [Acidobacteria bacterium]|nr:dihydroorotate dehydrogenase [Acidobacteriota bacterium]MBI3656104.1 dihydroorotate dehydrogenase [Acidobacteriota bacterium]